MSVSAKLEDHVLNSRRT